MARRSGDVAYAATRAKTRRNQLLPGDAYARMLLMEIPEISRVLGEAVYRPEMEAMATRFRGVDLLEEATQANLARTYREVLSFSRGPLREQVALYLRRWDLWNVKTILRGKFARAPADEIRADLIPAGELSPAFLDELLEAGSAAGVVEALKGTPFHEPLARALADSGQGEAVKNLMPLENRLDRLYYETLLARRPATRADALFRDFVRVEVDVVNLRTLLRMKADDQPAEKVREFLLAGGKYLKPELLRRLAEAPAAEVPGLLRGTPLAGALSPLEQDPRATGKALRALEKFHLSKARAFGHAYPLSALPVLDLLLRKKNEVDNIRIIARGKEAGMGEEEIREQLVM
ncbi:MAG: ATP synthase A1 subunit C [Halobacteria archaeon]